MMITMEDLCTTLAYRRHSRLRRDGTRVLLRDYVKCAAFQALCGKTGRWRKRAFAALG